MKKTLVSILLLISILLCAVSCSSYTAIGLVKSSGVDRAYAKWQTLNGIITLDTYLTGASEGELAYTASLDEGEVNVYYETALLGKSLLFTVKGGEEISSSGGYVEDGQKIRIIIETVGTTRRGKIEVKPVNN